MPITRKVTFIETNGHIQQKFCNWMFGQINRKARWHTPSKSPDLTRFGSCEVSFAPIGQKSGLPPNNQLQQNFDECDQNAFRWM